MSSCRGHVLFVLENLPIAEDQRARKQLDSLLADGYEVTVVSPKDRTDARYAGVPGVRLRTYPGPPEPGGPVGYLVEYVWSLAWATVLSLATRVSRPIDVVQLCQPPDTDLVIAWILRRLGAKVLVDQRDLMPELFGAKYGADRGAAAIAVLGWIERLSHRRADHVITVNHYLWRRGTASTGDPSRVSIVRNGPVLGSVRAARRNRSLRRSSDHLICWIGKMGRQDRVDLVVSAIGELFERRPQRDVAVAIVGDGECLDELRDLVDERGLSDRISFTGWLSEAEAYRYLASADLGMDASLQKEVSPVKAVEYMAFGLPFVAFDLEETRTVAEGAATLVPPGDITRFAAAIDELLGDQRRRAHLGEAGRERVIGELAWDQQEKVYLSVIDRLVRAPRRQSPRFTARYGRSATSASHGAGSRHEKTASVSTAASDRR